MPSSRVSTRRFTGRARNRIDGQNFGGRGARVGCTSALSRTPTEHLALKLLARAGIAAIWQLHIAAAQVYRRACPRAAAMVAEIAEAAEQASLRAAGESALV